MVTTNDSRPELPDEISTSSNKAMVTTNDDPPEFPDEISTSSDKGKHCFSLQPCLRFLEELVYEIFVRLPVKSLIRFRCVSKGMRRLIDSPFFIKNHNIHRSVISEIDREYAIFLYQPRLHRLFSLSFDKDDNRGKAIELNSCFVKEGMMEGMGWCCNGIFCFKTTHTNPISYVFWNPSNGTFRKVDCSTFSNVSWGYDSVNDDYKIISFKDSESETRMEVYSLRKDSWRKLPRDFPPGRYISLRSVCLNGVMHCLWTNSTDNSVFIGAFDLATETFTSLPLPLEARQLRLLPCQFTDFGGRLCITFFPSSYDGAETIWVMEKHGIESSWSKLYNLPSTEGFTRSFYFPDSRRRLLCNFRWLSWWDPQDDSLSLSFERIEIPGLLNDQALIPSLYYYEAYVYVRNLLRLDQSPF